MMETLLPYIPLIVTFLITLLFVFERGKSLLLFFQQEEYDDLRFINWLKTKKGYDKTATFWLLACVLLATIAQVILPKSTAIVGLVAMLVGWAFLYAGLIHGMLRSRRAQTHNKKPLVMTARAKRIFDVYLLVSVGLAAFMSFLSLFAPKGAHYSLNIDAQAESLWDMANLSELTYDWQLAALALMFILLVQSLPFCLILANKLLEPFEERVKAKYKAEAISKFNSLKPKVIAITGSFGKTSTKHVLSHILSAAAPTLATPGSVNTEMGITRVIRESLTPEHQFFIVEMGAYGPGSIARLCKLTPPDCGLITAIGAAHYERFKSLETVAAAKFELAEAVFAKNGDVVVSTDAIPKHLLEDRMRAVPGTYIPVGVAGRINLTAFEETKEGIILTLLEEGEEHILRVPLYGKHQAGNILLAAATARTVGLPWSAIKGALASMPQIRHRLEVTRHAGGPTILNDAYNSNPVGFASALESLDVLAKDTGRRILITPGMVELGEKHAAEHEALGTLAAQYCDIVLVVTPSRIPTFLKALTDANEGQTTILTFEKQEDAENWARANWRSGDAVLFENNLPDLYEATVNF